MKYTKFCWHVLLWVSLASSYGLAQTQLNLASQSRNIDFTNAPMTKPFKTGTILPATCTLGEAFFKTDANAGQNWFGCTALNVWSQQAGVPSVGLVQDLTISKTSPTTLTIVGGRWGLGSTTFSYPGGTVSIQTFAISGATNASPIVITVGSTALLRNGDTLNIAGVQGNTAANGTFAISVVNQTQFSLIGSTGNGNYTSGGTVTGNATGTARIYASENGNIIVEHPASAGLVVSCSGNCVVNQVLSPTVPANGFPLAEISIANGQWDTLTDTRHLLGNRGIAAGQGIVVNDAGGVARIAVDTATVARMPGNNIWTGANSFTAAPRTAPFRVAAGAPAGQNCIVGDTYWQNNASAGQNLWGCTASGSPGQWTSLTGSSAIAPVMEEEFYSSSATADDYGQYHWRGVGDNAPVAYSLSGSAGYNHPGLYAISTNAAANSVSAITMLASSGSQTYVNLGATTGWTLEAIAVTQEVMPVSQVQLRFGLSSDPSNSNAAHAVQLRYNNNTGCTVTGSDSVLVYENRSVGASASGQSGQAPGSLQSIHLRVRSVTAGSALFSVSINGAPFTSEVSVSGVPTAGVSPFFAVTSCNNTAMKVYADYFRFTPGALQR